MLERAGTDGCLVGGESGSGSYPVFNFNQGPPGYGCQKMTAPPVATAATVFAPHEQDHTILNPGDMWCARSGWCFSALSIAAVPPFVFAALQAMVFV